MSRKLKRDIQKQRASREEGLTGIHKRFSELDYEETKSAVDTIILWHEAHDIHCDHNHLDKFGPDIVEWVGFHPSKYIEVAQRSAWKKGDWNLKWDPVNIEERKLHLFKLSLPCDYWVVSGDHKSALVIPCEVVRKYIDNLEEVSNRTVKEGEKFIRIPLSECEQVDLELDDGDQ